MTPPAVAEMADAAADVFGYLRSRLSGSERDRFDLEFFDATRAEEPEILRRVLIGWLLTVMVRDHPDHEEQYKDFVRLRESEEAFADTPLAGQPSPLAR